jgi:hypothetical protein
MNQHQYTERVFTGLYQPKIKYISGEIIANNVMNSLKTYFEKGLVDESHIYKPMRSCLNRIGLKVFPIRYATIPIIDKIGELPCDYMDVLSAIGVAECKVLDYNPDQFKVVETPTTHYTLSTPVCSRVPSTPCQDECGNLYELVQEFDIYKLTLNQLFNVTVKTQDNSGSVNVLQQSSQEEIVIKDNKIFANFDGYVYLEYLADLIEKTDIKVPDYSQITDWIEMEIMVECLRSIYLNGEADVLQRLQYVEGVVRLKESIARNFFKAFEYHDLYNLSEILKRRFEKYKYK